MIRELLAATTRVLLAAPAYEYLVRFLDIMDETRWNDVQLGQSERSGHAGIRSERSPTERRRYADYLYIDTVTGSIVDPCAAKRRRYSMCGGDYLHTHVKSHCAFVSWPSSTFQTSTPTFVRCLTYERVIPTGVNKRLRRGTFRERINKRLSTYNPRFQRKGGIGSNKRTTKYAKRFAAG